MEEVLDGVYALTLEFDFGGSVRDIHPAAVETDTGLVLIDTGYVDHVEAIVEELASAGFGLEDVELIVMTHQDIDHAGALAAIQSRTDAPTLASGVDAPAIRGDEDLLKGVLGDYPDARVDVELVDGVVIETASGPMEVIETPGHTPGHLSLYFPDHEFLIAGDALTAEGGLDGPNEDFTPDLTTATESIGRLAERSIERTLCFHGGYVTHASSGIAQVHEQLTQ